ncbi:TNF receptor-associated factor 6 isoform X3 [Ixodes scapularis]
MRLIASDQRAPKLWNANFLKGPYTAVPEIFPEDCDPPPDNELTCPICRALLREPVECRCRHVFCKDCIMVWLSTNSTCPLCRVSLQGASLVPAHPLIQSMVGNVKVKCRSPGCSARVAVSTYTTHLGVCEFKEVPCPHGLCEHRCPRRTLEDHVKTCPHRMLTCQLGCRATMSAGELENHSCMLKLRLRETRARLQKCQQEACDIKCDRDGWERKAEDASRKLESVRNDLAKTTADRDSWKLKAEDASYTLKSVRNDLAKTTAGRDSWKLKAEDASYTLKSVRNDLETAAEDARRKLRNDLAAVTR